MLFNETLHVGRPNIGNQEEFQRKVRQLLDSKWLSNNGPMVQELEDEIEKLLGVRHCVLMTNGTVALEIVARALGLTGEVIIPSYTFVATAHALSWQGLKPTFADIDPKTHTLDPDSVVAAITSRTTGIVGVHLWGRPAAVAELQRIARAHDLKLIFDAAHAFSNSMGDRMIGGFGDAEVFSFHATKFFNTFEGGAVTTNDDELAHRVTLMRNFGFKDFDEVVYHGTNGKMPEISAAMGLVNLQSLPEFVDRNASNHSAYAEVFARTGDAELLPFDPRNKSNKQYAVVELSREMAQHRDRLVADLHAQNVRARRYFWPGCHRMEPYRTCDPDAGQRLPNTAAVADRVVVLPTGMAVNPDDCQRIATYILDRLSCYAAVDQFPRMREGQLRAV